MSTDTLDFPATETTTAVVTEAEAGGNGSPKKADHATEEKAKPKHKVLYIDRFRLTTPLNPGSGEPINSSFILGMYRGNPRLIIRTNDPQDQENNYGRLVAPMDPTTFEVFLEFITKAVNATEKVSYAIVNKTLWERGQKLDEPKMLNRVIVGRTDDGRIWFTIQEGTRPTPRFVFGPSSFHDLTLPSPTDATELVAEISRTYARNMANSMRGVVNAVAARFLMGEEEAEDESASAEAANLSPAGDRGANERGNGGWQGRNNGGNNNWRGNGGNGGWQGRNNNGGGGRGNWGGGGGRGNWNGGGGRGGYGGGNGGGYNGGGRGGYGGGGGNGGGNGYQQRNQNQSSPGAGVSDDDIPL